MKQSDKKYIINSILSLVLIFIISLTALTAVRYFQLQSNQFWTSGNIRISPSGLDDKYDASKECTIKSLILSSNYTARFIPELFAEIYSILDNKNNYRSYRLEDNGLIKVQDYIYSNASGKKIIHLGWWGPNGFSENPDASLGRFPKNVIVYPYPTGKRIDAGTENDRFEAVGIAIDNKGKKIYKINSIRKIIAAENSRFDEKIEYHTSVSDIPYGDITITNLPFAEKIDPQTSNTDPAIGIDSAGRKPTAEELNLQDQNSLKVMRMNGQTIEAVRMENDNQLSTYSGHMALDDQANIYKIDYHELTLKKVASLPARPEDLHMYTIQQFSRSKYIYNDDNHWDTEFISYAGSAVFSHHKDGTISLEVFDQNGKNIKKQSHKTVLAAAERGTYEFYLLGSEMFYGLGFHTAALLFSDMITPENIKESMIIMPYSFVSRALHQNDSRKSEMITWAFTTAIINCIFFAYLLRHSYKKSGLPARYFKFWVIMIILLGPMAYIAYQLSKPGIKQVTCGNCGSNRRPDQDKCMHCNAGWQLPHLDPIGWSIK